MLLALSIHDVIPTQVGIQCSRGGYTDLPVLSPMGGRRPCGRALRTVGPGLRRGDDWWFRSRPSITALSVDRPGQAGEIDGGETRVWGQDFVAIARSSVGVAAMRSRV